jgi:hypothetical protein
VPDGEARAAARSRRGAQGITEAFKACTAPEKLNLGVGAYRDDNLKPVVLEVRACAARHSGALFAPHALCSRHAAPRCRVSPCACSPVARAAARSARRNPAAATLRAKRAHARAHAARPACRLALLLQVVKKAEQQLLARELAGTENKEYLGMDGLPAFNKLTAQLLFGADFPALKEGRVATIQGLSVRGSHCLHARWSEVKLPAARRRARGEHSTLTPHHHHRADTHYAACCAGHGLASPGRRLHRQVHAGPGAWRARSRASATARALLDAPASSHVSCFLHAR